LPNPYLYQITGQFGWRLVWLASLKIQTLSNRVISSPDNSLLRHARAVREGKIKDQIFVEGLRVCEEALSSGLSITAIIHSEEFSQKSRANKFFSEVTKVCTRVVAITESLMRKISDTKTPQGIIILADRPDTGEQVLNVTTKAAPLLVLMHGLNNPVNVGAILRTAEATGVTGVISTLNTSDPFSPKALRGAMGSTFRLPIWHGDSLQNALAWCAEHDVTSASSAPQARILYTDYDWKIPTAIVIGPEANGLSFEEIQATDTSLKIPMHGHVESLNVAVATAVLLYEAARQRESREL